VVLHLLTNRREDLVRMRTQTINRLHRLLVDLIPGGAGRNLTAAKAAGLLGQVTPTGAPAVARRQLAADLIADVEDLDRRIAAVEARIRVAVAQSTTGLVELFGVGPVLAAKLLGEVGTSAGSRASIISRPIPAPRRWRPPAARWSAPVVAGRGSQAEPRPVHDGDGQVRRPSAGQAYYRRKLAEGKSPKEALRCLKRRLSDAVYRCLMVDKHRRAAAASGLASAR
jgi:transposase